MPDPTSTATAAASNPPVIDMDALAKAIGGQVTAALNPIVERIGKLETAAKPPEQTASVLTAADVSKIVADAVGAGRSADAKRAARDGYAREKMKDVPSAYLAGLPETDDAAQLSAAEQKIRAQYQADLKAAGVTAKDVGAAAAGGDSPATRANAPDLSKVPASKKVEMLVASSQPGRPGTQGAETATAATTAAA